MDAIPTVIDRRYNREPAEYKEMAPAQEAQRLLQLHNQNPAAALEVLERQLNTLNGRSDIVLSVAGIVITVTGFSGRLIAATSLAAQVFIVAGMCAVAASVAWVLFKVSRIRWVTAEFEGEPEAALARIIERRNDRTRACLTCISQTRDEREIRTPRRSPWERASQGATRSRLTPTWSALCAHFSRGVRNAG